MESNKLPDNSKDILFVTFTNVFSTNTYKLNSSLDSRIDSANTIVVLLVDIVRFLFESVPVDGAGLDLVDDLAEQVTVASLVVEVADDDLVASGVQKAKRVHPHAEGSFFARARVVPLHVSNFGSLLFGQLESVLGVEDFGDENGVDLCVSAHDVSARRDVGDAHIGGVLDHFLGA